jgi:hypothetical protein
MEGVKKLGTWMVWAFLATGCATSPTIPLVDCARDAALARGVKDGAGGRKASLSFLQTCTAETRVSAKAAYREGYASARPKKKEAAIEPIEEIEDDGADVATDTPAPPVTPVREPSAAVSWVCEIEANSRVFTGAGLSRDEALGAARATCGSHFQASYCTKADCKQNL